MLATQFPEFRKQNSHTRSLSDWSYELRPPLSVDGEGTEEVRAQDKQSLPVFAGTIARSPNHALNA